MWEANEDNLESIAVGAGILGTGGGGNPYIGQLRARQAIRERGPVTVLDPEELPEDSQVICVGGIGAPTVGIESLNISWGATPQPWCAPLRWPCSSRADRRSLAMIVRWNLHRANSLSKCSQSSWVAPSRAMATPS